MNICFIMYPWVEIDPENDTSLALIKVVKKLQRFGLTNASKYYTDSFITNDHSNKNLDFILNSL